MDEEAPARLVEVASLEEHDDIVSTLAASHSHGGLVLSGSYDRRYDCARVGCMNNLSTQRVPTILFHICLSQRRYLLLTNQTHDGSLWLT